MGLKKPKPEPKPQRKNIKLHEEKKSVKLLIGENKLTLHHGDITNLAADAVVCPVNRSLDTTLSIADVIMKSAGRGPRRHRPLHPEPMGKVVVLPGGKLKCKYIFLTVLLGESGLDRIRFAINQAVDRTIRYAEFLRLESIAFPVLGSPTAAPPYDFIAKEMLDNVAQYFRRRNTQVKAVLFSVFNSQAFEAFRKEAKNIANR